MNAVRTRIGDIEVNINLHPKHVDRKKIILILGFLGILVVNEKAQTVSDDNDKIVLY